MNAYVESVIEYVKKKHANEPEFCQTVEEVFSSISPMIDKHPEYEKADLLKRMVEPERMFTFRVVWTDDNGQAHTNIGYRCQFNGAIGPYKGGLRFQANVTPSVIKFLGFEQTFKNSLTGLPMGGGKGGSDFDPAGKSDAEVMRFCQSYMTALYRYIGPDVDVPAGDMGVGGREIGYLYGQYRRLKGVWENGVLTGKGFTYGGSLIRPEATGYGAVYYLQEVLAHENDTIEGKRIAISGYGNVGWGIMKKAAELGAKVTYFAGPDGYIHDPDGVTGEKLDYILEMRAKDPMHCQPYAEKYGCEFVPGAKCWGVKDVDVYMPAATQNEVVMAAAEKIAADGGEGAGKRDRREGGAALEGGGADVGHAVRNGDGVQLIEGIERPIADGGHAALDGDGSNVGAGGVPWSAALGEGGHGACTGNGQCAVGGEKPCDAGSAGAGQGCGKR